jgi:hypothetical protein
MADYAATPLQVIAHGLIAIDAAGDPIVTGRGFSSIERSTGGPGDFTLTFDEGTIASDISSGQLINQPGGNGLPDGRIGPYAIDPDFARVAMMMRGGTTAPGSTTLTPRSVAFVSTPGAGATQIRVVVVDDTDTATDPMGPGAPNASGGGMEIIVWYGGAAPDDVTQQAVGPLYQPAMAFP